MAQLVENAQMLAKATRAAVRAMGLELFAPSSPGAAVTSVRPPAGMDSAADLPKITQALLDRGYSADDIRKILGGNLLRVFREAEHVSREMQAQTH